MITHRKFHCSIHASGTDGTAALRADAPERFACTYDQIAGRLVGLPRLFLEPDGSFVWVGRDHGDGPQWRLDGQLTDGGPALEFMELKGYCGREQLDGILTALGWPQQAVHFHLCEQGIYLDEVEFRRRYLGPG